MALFNDGPISSAADLQRYENAILNVASTESIDLGVKLMLAQQELANQLMLFLSRRPSVGEGVWARRGSRGVRDVVVTEPLRQWHAYKSLELIYRDAYNNQLNDRYQGKWTEYQQLVKASERSYFKIGVGLVMDPLPKALSPLLSTVGGSAPTGTFYVAAAWVNAAGEEGAASDLATLNTSDGQQLTVSMSGAPSHAVGWNVYAGGSPSTLSLQNETPLATTAIWSMETGLIPGPPPPTGQRPTWFVVDHHTIQRG